LQLGQRYLSFCEITHTMLQNNLFRRGLGQDSTNFPFRSIHPEHPVYLVCQGAG
jgi:hypothetical protein